MMNLLKESKKRKIISLALPIFIALSNKVHATDIVSEVEGGGQIQNSKLGQGLLNMVKDITGTMQWILPIVRSMFHIVLRF